MEKRYVRISQEESILLPPKNGLLDGSKDHIGKAIHNLCVAGNNSSAVENLIIMGLIEKAVRLEHDIKSLINAISMESKES